MSEKSGAPAISLTFRHPSADLSEIPEMLGMKASRIWRVGDPVGTLSGRILEGVRAESYCSFRIPSVGGEFFFDAIVSFHSHAKEMLSLVTSSVAGVSAGYHVTVDRECDMAGILDFESMKLIGGDNFYVGIEVLFE